MGIWIGIDGGGSKTSFLAINTHGERLASYTTGGIDYHQIGVDKYCSRLLEGFSAVSAGINVKEIYGIGIGMPSYGEDGTNDRIVVNKFRSFLSDIPVAVVNDAESCWLGSLAMKPGVNVVAGTGAIAYGRDEYRSCARSGGWSELFSDEGSGYWLGRLALGLFAKQSDGRVPRSALYSLIKNELGLSHDMDLCSIARDRIFTSRKQVASIQKVLARAASEGDKSAVNLYRIAGAELAESVNAVIGKLEFRSDIIVSYSGGVFSAGEIIMKPFREALPPNTKLMTPALPPEVGAVFAALETFQPEQLKEVLSNCINNGYAYYAVRVPHDADA